VRCEYPLPVGRIYKATWGRGFAAIYDRAVRATEEAGLREMRRRLLEDAGGRVLDVGAGTGANLGLFGPQATEVVFCEPDPHMAKRLRRKLSDSKGMGSIVEAGAESLPFEDASFDSVIFTLVLCTVSDPAAALAEAARVLRPGGRMLFIEHVRSEEARLARWQDRLHRPWHFFADGCNCNRDTVGAIDASPLEIESVDRDELPKALPIVKPLVRGRALAPADVK
jgi:SAM-dependent methyltransferase